MKLVYNDTNHSYYLDGKRAKSVTGVAKIVTDTFAIEQWDRRQVAIGLAMDRNLVENVAVDIDNRDALNNICEEAKKIAGAHRSADRGTQKHRVLELVLLDQEHKLLTDQQRADADVLNRTLDLYKLTLHDGMAEQFVAWPHYTVTGRFDAIVETPNGKLILMDLKSGENAVLYPHSTGAQFALYARAPHVSDGVHTAGDRSTIENWRTMPERLEYAYGYVLLVEHDAKVGELYEIDMEHGWAGAQRALQLVEWRKQKNWGKDMVRAVPPPLTLLEQIPQAPHLTALRSIWEDAVTIGEATPAFRAAAIARSQELKAGVV